MTTLIIGLRMRPLDLRVLLMVLCCCGSAALAADGDPCAYPEAVHQEFLFQLNRSYVTEQGFFGVFTLENHSPLTITVPGHRRNTGFTIGRPETTVQFKDLTGNWEPLLSLPGSFLPRPDRLIIRPGGKETVTIYLMSADTANKSASQFRVLVRLLDPPTCITSVPYVPTPPREPVTGFESLH